MQFEIQWQRIIALNATGKENRMQKLQEEQGELAGALLMSHRQPLMSECVDVLLMLLSIYGDHAPNDPAIADNVGESLTRAIRNFSEMQNIPFSVAETHLVLCQRIGKLAELNQKIDGVASSSYKLAEGTSIDQLEAVRLRELMWAMNLTCALIASTEFSQVCVQAEYNTKMDKWERVSK